jgi:Cytochrome c554 and c-prime
MRLRAAALLLACCAGVNGTAPTPDCAACHPAESKLHANTRMAHAMVPAPDSEFAKDLPDRPVRESGDGYMFTYHRVEKGIEVTTRRASDKAEGLIEWVLGAGAQGQTPLVRMSDSTLESRVSYFPQLHTYGITIGQDAGASTNAHFALGRKQTSDDLQSCIGCHATAITRNLQPVIPGVQCERCHLGADEHANGGRKPPLNPGKLDSQAQVRFCGNCHRVKAPVDDTQLENVRFQPLRLMKSRCFASGKLACTTCHVAHQDARRNDPDFYNQKCHACHDGRAFHADQRQKGDCIGCHMPYVQLHPALKFTDHFIRIVKVGDLPPSTIRQRAAGS